MGGSRTRCGTRNCKRSREKSSTPADTAGTALMRSRFRGGLSLGLPPREDGYPRDAIGIAMRSVTATRCPVLLSGPRGSQDSALVRACEGNPHGGDRALQRAKIEAAERSRVRFCRSVRAPTYTIVSLESRNERRSMNPASIRRSRRDPPPSHVVRSQLFHARSLRSLRARARAAIGTPSIPPSPPAPAELTRGINCCRPSSPSSGPPERFSTRLSDTAVFSPARVSVHSFFPRSVLATFGSSLPAADPSQPRDLVRYVITVHGGGSGGGTE